MSHTPHMAMRRFSWLLSSNQIARDEDLLNRVREYGTAPGNADFVWLVPNARRAQYVRRKWGEAYTPAIVPLETYLDSLLDVYGLAYDKSNLLSDLQAEAVMEEAVHRSSPYLQHFHRDSLLRPGVLRSLVTLVRFLKMNAYDEKLLNILRLGETKDPTPRDHDIGYLYGIFNGIMDSEGYSDRASRLLRVKAALEEGKVFPGLTFPKCFILDGFTFLQRLEESVLRSIANRSDDVILTTDTPLSGDQFLAEVERERSDAVYLDHRVYRPLAAWVRSFTEADLKSKSVVMLGDSRERDPLCYFPLFRRDSIEDHRNGESSANCPISLSSYSTRSEEIREIARSIKQMVLKGESISEIHVAFPAITPYVALIYEIFPEYGIPFSITRGLPLPSTPIAAVVTALLEVPQEYSREALFRLFSSNLVRWAAVLSESDFESFCKRMFFSDDSRAFTANNLIDRYRAYAIEQRAANRLVEHLDLPTLDRFARSANIRGGLDLRGDWVLPLESYFQMRLRTDQREDPELLQRTIFRIARQLYLLDKLQALLLPLRAQTDPRAILRDLRSLMDQLGIQKNVVQRLEEMPGLQIRDQMLLLKRDTAALEQIESAFEELHLYFDMRIRLGLAEGIYGSVLELVARAFERILQEKFVLDPLEEKAVQITETLELRSLPVNVLFFAGLTAEEFPRRKPPEVLLPHNPNLTFRMLESADESRYLLSSAIRNTTGHLYLSWPRTDAGISLEMSPFLLDLPERIRRGGDSIDQDSDAVLSSSELEGLYGETRLGGLLEFSSRPEQMLESLAIEDARQPDMPYGAWDGIFLSDRESPVLSEDHRFSISQLDTIAICPQQYFYARILNLEPLDEVTEEMERDEFGTYVHEVLEYFSKEWMARGETRITPENINAARILMFQTGKERLSARGGLDDFVLWDEKQRKMLGGLEVIETNPNSNEDPNSVEPPGILRSLLENEAARNREPISMREVEKSFGFGEDHFDLEGVNLRGKIDRLDAWEGMGFQGYLLIDYKTGKAPDLRKRINGTSYQLPVYLMAAQRIYPSAVFGAAYYELRDPLQVRFQNLLLDDSLREGKAFGQRRYSYWMRSTETYLKHVRARIVRLADAVRRGQFHVAFDDQRCGFCDYRWVCRRDEERVHRLSLDETLPYFVPNREGKVLSALLSFEHHFQNLLQIVEKRENSTRKSNSLSKDDQKTLEKLSNAFEGLDKPQQKIKQREYEALVRRAEAFRT